jgi:phospholipase/lecithinase/hemolysin
MTELGLPMLSSGDNQKDKMRNIQKKMSFLVGILLVASSILPAQGAFSALYAFGDGITTTTNNPSPGPYYYGKRYSNGRVWVEVLAQRQGVLYDSNKNWSYFYNSSTTLVTHVSSFNAPADASNALFVVWVNCADLWFPAIYNPGTMSVWTSAINQSQTNHYRAVTNLYFAKGVRTLIMPNAVDLSTIPEFNNSTYASFIHLRCLEYNVAFSNTLNRIRVTCPDLRLYAPDFFALLTNMLAYPANYGLTNALGNGKSIDAVHAQNFGMPIAATNGFGTNFIFWNPNNPTAMVHTWMANRAQQLLSPARIDRIVVLEGSNRLDLANVPIGQNGLVLGCTNLATTNWLVPWNWTTNVSFSGIATTQSVFVSDAVLSDELRLLPNGGPWPPPPIYVPGYTWKLYRLQFPYAWTWP